MLSPNRATRILASAARAAAARTQTAMRFSTRWSEAWPATVVRAMPRRVWMNPNSRSPWAAWFRFMKSMSMSAQGSASLACVCRCRSGLWSTSRPVIHIFAGLNVCIHVTTPTQSSSALASSMTRRMAPASVSTGLATTGTGICSAPSRASEMTRDWSATWVSTSSPYSPWLPVRNQTVPLMPVSSDMRVSRGGVDRVDRVVGHGIRRARLSVDVLVAVEQRVDVMLGDRDRLPELASDVDAPRDVLHHHRGLDRVSGVGSDRERPVVLHQHRAGPALAQGLHDAASDGVVPDDGERPHRDVAAELVGHHRQHARDRLAPGRPRA